MSGYNIEYFLKDFTDRTVKNLEFIELNTNRYGLYEVTQLINSLLGLIIVPYEASRKVKEITDVELRKISVNDYDYLDSLIIKCQREKRLYSDYHKNDSERKNNGLCVKNFIRHIRNSIAHGGNEGIHFIPITDNGVISNIIFYDTDINIKENNLQKSHKFVAKLSVDEVKLLVYAISNLYCKFENKDKNVKKKQITYQRRIDELEALLQSVQD